MDIVKNKRKKKNKIVSFYLENLFILLQFMWVKWFQSKILCIYLVSLSNIAVHSLIIILQVYLSLDKSKNSRKNSNNLWSNLEIKKI